MSLISWSIWLSSLATGSAVGGPAGVGDARRAVGVGLERPADGRVELDGRAPLCPADADDPEPGAVADAVGVI